MRYRPEIDGYGFLLSFRLFYFTPVSNFLAVALSAWIFSLSSAGYLITTIILAELEDGRFSILNFYERRARRILPALYLVMAMCLPFAWLWLMPSDVEEFSKSAMAVLVFASNIFFGSKVITSMQRQS